MGIQKINNYSIGKDLKEELGTTLMDLNIDHDVIPVAIVNSLRGINKVNSRQTNKHITVLQSTGASATTQLATVSDKVNVYYLGMVAGSTATAGTGQVNIDDATAGTPTITDQSSTQLGSMQATAVSGTYPMFPPVPIKCVNGLRVNCVGPSTGSAFAFIYWVEENVV